MGQVIERTYRQALLRAALPDGTILLLVTLDEKSCAILRDGEIVMSSGSDAEAIDDAVRQFLVMTQAAPRG